MKVTKQNVKKAGFSLVEMLVVIAVIGIIAAIAVPNIGKINDSAKDARKRRNAQSLASIFASAQAAGWNFLKANGSTGADLTEAATITKVIAGKQITEVGPFTGAFFGVTGLNTSIATSETKGAAKYLSISNGMLLYTGGSDVGD